MLLYGILIVLVGLILLSSAAAIVIGLHRRYALPYALLTVGIITYSLSLLVQGLILRLIDGPLLNVLSIAALVSGLVAGFTEEIARALGFQYLARTTVTKPQAMMIGAGHAIPEVLYYGIVAVILGMSLFGYGSDRPDDLGAITSGALAEALNGILPILMHMALSWLVLQVFLRGQLFWLFLAIFFHAQAETMAALLGPGDAWAVVIWRTLIALISLLILTRLRPQAAE
jgi:uncharacterized membrane protein YhfC